METNERVYRLEENEPWLGWNIPEGWQKRDLEMPTRVLEKFLLMTTRLKVES